MALPEKLRSSIFRRLSPLIGEEETSAVLSYFPARDVEDPVTKEHLQLELALVRTEIEAVRTDVEKVRTDVEKVRTDVANFRAEVHQLANRLLVTMITATIAVAGLALTIALKA